MLSFREIKTPNLKKKKRNDLPGYNLDSVRSANKFMVNRVSRPEYLVGVGGWIVVGECWVVGWMVVCGMLSVIVSNGGGGWVDGCRL